MTDTTFSAPSQPSGGETITITYEEKPGLGWLSIKNWLLSILTLGIYRFWAKTDVRKHVWSSVHVNGEPLEYTGRGIELFLGAVVIFFIVFLPFAVLVNGLQLAGYPMAALSFQFLLMFVFLALYGMAVYRARRYRLSRTVWRGIRGGLTGSSFKYSMLYFGTILLSGVTMGWSNPAMNLELQERITREMKFGDAPFEFRGRAGPLYARYAACWFGSIVAYIIIAIIGVSVFFALGGTEGFQEFFKSFDKKMNDADPTAVIAFILTIFVVIGVFSAIFGVIWSFYKAREMVLFAQYTSFDNAHFRLNATGWSLVGLWFGNLLLVIFTLGIAAPFTVQRMVKYFVDRLEVVGWVNVGQIMQSQQALESRGEGLMDAFDIDGI